MNIFEAAVLGIVQGLAEFLPISSSGHLEFFEHLMNVDVAGGAGMLLMVLLHMGTLISVIVVFWADWMAILRNPFKSKTLGLLIVASIPALLAAVLLGDTLDSLFGSGLLGVSFLVTGVFLLLAQRVSAKGRHQVKNQEVTLKNALCMGGMQAVAILPGVSRSGSTLLGGVASGLPRQSAAKFSFMMSAPAILGSLLVEGKNALESGAFDLLSQSIVPMAVGILLAAVSGYLAIRYFLKLINRVSLNWFALYVFLLGGAIIVMQLCGVSWLPSFAAPAA